MFINEKYRLTNLTNMFQHSMGRKIPFKLFRFTWLLLGTELSRKLILSGQS